ncbi:MAG: putative addiction module antidote protein [Acidobacteria bacterium]|nr:putative addiction module antidote protein [Acidobacteriota bacterium]
MKKSIKIDDIPKFDAARYLKSEETIAAYLTEVLKENDAALLATALGDIARARGMAQIAKDSGIGRESLYKALRPDSEPRLDTISRVCNALGVRLVAQPIHAPEKPKRKRRKAATLNNAA